MQLSMHKSVQYDSIKGEIEVALYAALKGTSNISFHLKLNKTLMIHLLVQLRMHLRDLSVH